MTSFLLVNGGGLNLAVFILRERFLTYNPISNHLKPSQTIFSLDLQSIYKQEAANTIWPNMTLISSFFVQNWNDGHRHKHQAIGWRQFAVCVEN